MNADCETLRREMPIGPDCCDRCHDGETGSRMSLDRETVLKDGRKVHVCCRVRHYLHDWGHLK